LFIPTLLVAPVVFAGCGDPPQARFVLSGKTLKLDRAAKNAVDAELQRSFGDPNHLVAWRKLPVDFGDFEGTVEQGGAHLSDSLRVKLTRKSEAKFPFKLEAIKGAALIWTSGENAGELAAKDEKGKEQPISFQVTHYDPSSSELKIRVIPPQAAGALAAPQPGDKFAVVGPVLQYGHKLYMTHCLHCHGTSGDGNGPTAKYLSPRPRDYRLGVFKFTSTRTVDKIRRDDLERTIHQGLPGTYMPSFLLLTEEEVGAIIEYIRWLSMRGEFEEKCDIEFAQSQYGTEDIAQRVKGGEKREEIEAALATYLTDEFPGIVERASGDVANAWITAEKPDSVVIPKQARTADSAESRERGRKLFLSNIAKCSTCHGLAGRGDGPQTEDYQQILGTNKKRTVPGLFDDWGNPIKPRDLTTGIYRGGRRPVDLYRRVFSGIKGTPMPAFGAALKDAEIWDIVNYVMSVPYQKGPSYAEQEQQHIASSSPQEFEGSPVHAPEGN
jgi:mono/diheme cytochrome c family protein